MFSNKQYINEPVRFYEKGHEMIYYINYHRGFHAVKPTNAAIFYS